ncbi:energy-coupled thiamine transporter ThiT [Pseudogracilibacillus auburnensis]|uniref:Thiamine transporter n=1 Tax=Pseudogracilibacillus auburnensis TaxID=1494959 RepID=A0A2V3VY87_9BACI|nr:energy-coupled thiamine transporter ThiT [Pseudogracilibacillus auburnensis]MBO1004032.1 energy-coupled thiamine transporter ThiT [Pseudogracilibacillus auburnensis]PXW85678.1 thiamine transporter [Pseudogracilibacillus auburnensis]
MSSKRTLFFIEVAILTALALLLDIIPFLKFKIWPAGGSISLAMIPVFIIAFRWGLKGGLLSGFLWGILQIAVGDAYILNFWQGLIEYGLAFTVLGFAGLFAKPVQQAVRNKNAKATFAYVLIGVLVGGSLRFTAHVVAGFVFFAEYAPEDQPAWLYSFIYNCTYMIPAMIICIIVIFFLFNRQPRTLLRTAS